MYESARKKPDLAIIRMECVCVSGAREEAANKWFTPKERKEGKSRCGAVRDYCKAVRSTRDIGSQSRCNLSLSLLLQRMQMAREKNPTSSPYSLKVGDLLEETISLSCKSS